MLDQLVVPLGGRRRRHSRGGTAPQGGGILVAVGACCCCAACTSCPRLVLAVSRRLGACWGVMMLRGMVVVMDRVVQLLRVCCC